MGRETRNYHLPWARPPPRARSAWPRSEKPRKCPSDGAGEAAFQDGHLIFKNRSPKNGSFKKKGPSSLLYGDISLSEQAENTKSGRGIRDGNSQSVLLGSVLFKPVGGDAGGPLIQAAGSDFNPARVPRHPLEGRSPVTSQ